MPAEQSPSVQSPSYGRTASGDGSLGIPSPLSKLNRSSVRRRLNEERSVLQRKIIDIEEAQRGLEIDFRHEKEKAARFDGTCLIMCTSDRSKYTISIEKGVPTHCTCPDEKQDSFCKHMLDAGKEIAERKRRSTKKLRAYREKRQNFDRERKALKQELRDNMKAIVLHNGPHTLRVVFRAACVILALAAIVQGLQYVIFSLEPAASSIASEDSLMSNRLWRLSTKGHSSPSDSEAEEAARRDDEDPGVNNDSVVDSNDSVMKRYRQVAVDMAQGFILVSIGRNIMSRYDTSVLLVRR